jgi:hypothetical protein
MWVPPAGSHEDPDFGYALVCRTVGSDHSITIDDLGNVPEACFDHLEPGLSYYFQVCACNCRGWGDWSNPSLPYMAPHPLPRPNGKPFNYNDGGTLGTVDDGRPLSSSEFATSATLHWDEPCSHGSQITGYNIEYSLDPSDPRCTVAATCMNRATSIEITDLIPNRVYYLRTQAINSVGMSDWTTWSPGVATAATPPDQPDIPELAEAKENDLRIKWTAPYSCGFRIINYTVRISEDSSMTNALVLPVKEPAKRVADDCTLCVVDLTPNSTYYFQVRAENEIGMSLWSESSKALQTKVSLPGPCTRVALISNVYCKLEVQWQAPHTFGLPITAYIVRWLNAEHPMKEQNRMEVQAFDGNNAEGNTMSQWVNGISPGSKLVFQVAAKSDAGLGPFSDVSESVTAIPGQPGPPPRPAVKLRTATSMKVQVEGTACPNGCVITGYECSWDTASTMAERKPLKGLMREVDVGSKEPGRIRFYEIEATGLTKRGPYYFSARALNSIGQSVWSTPSEGMMLHFSQPSKMSAPHFVESRFVALVVGYTPAAELGVIQGGGVRDYEMRYSRYLKFLESDDGRLHDEIVLKRWQATKADGRPPPPIVVEGLTTGCSYYFQIRSVTDNGTGSWSDSSEAFEVLPSKPETPPAPKLQMGTDGPYSILLSITLPEHNGRKIDSFSLQMYGPCYNDMEGSPEWKQLYDIGSIDVNEERVERQPLKDASEPTQQLIWHHTVIHLQPGASYKFMCRCENSLGMSEWSDESLSFSTGATAPLPSEPPVIMNDQVTSTSFMVHWAKPHNGGSEITHFRVLWASNPRFQNMKTVDTVEPELELTGLEPYQWYYMRVTAINSIGTGKYSEFDSTHGIGCFLTLARVPSAVCGLTAQILPNEDIEIKWGRPACTGGHIVSKYRIIASKTSDFEKIEFEMKQKAHRELILKDLAPDTSWFFDVSAANSVGYGPLTKNPAFVRTQAMAKIKAIGPRTPEAPVCAMREKPDGQYNLEVKWKCPEMYDKKKGFIFKSGVQTHMILSYNVRLFCGEPVPGVAEQIAEFTKINQVRDRRTVPKDEHNQVLHEKLRPGRYFTAMVQAESEVGLSDWSEFSMGVWSGAELPDAATDVKIVDRTQNGLMVQWACPHGNGDDVANFRMRWKGKRGTRHRMSLLSHVRGLASFKESLMQEASDEADNFSESSGSGWDDEEDDLGALHTVLDKEYYTDSGVHGVELTLAECKFGDPPNVEIPEFAPRGGLNLGQVCLYEIRGLDPGRFYCAEVQAVNCRGRSQWTHTSLMRTSSGIPDNPTHLKGLPDTATTTGVSFCWAAPVECRGEDIEGYEVAWMRVGYRQEPPKDFSAILDLCHERVQIPPAPCMFRAEGLLPGNMAVPIVRCWNCVGFSGWCWLEGGLEALEELATKPSKPSQMTIPPVIYRSAPIDYRPYSLSTSWKCPEINGWPIKYFLLKMFRVGDPPLGGENRGVNEKSLRLDHDGISPDWQEGDEVKLEFISEGLVPGTPYALNVRACTGDPEVGDCEDWGAMSTSDVAAPDYPLQPSPCVCPWQWPDALQITWEEPCMSGAPQTQCNACYSLSADMSNPIQIPNDDLKKAVQSKRLVVGGLSYTTEYFFKWRIANEVGWSPWSEISAAFLTKACRPAEPENLRAVGVLKESVGFVWTAPSDHGAAVTRYDIIFVVGAPSGGFGDNIKQLNDCTTDTAEEFDAEGADAAVEKVLSTMTLKSRARLDVEDAADPNTARHNFGDLLGGITYSAAVRAYNRCGWSDWSTIASFETPTAEPEVCQQAKFISADQSLISIEYRLPYDNGALVTMLEFTWSRMLGPEDRHKARTLGGKADDHHYHASGVVEVDISKLPKEERPEAAPPHGIGGRGDVLLEGLEPGTEYDVQYRAKNKNGFGPFSYVTRMLTAPGRPDAPGKVRHNAAAAFQDDGPESPGALSAPVSAFSPPTVCFARTSRLQTSEVVHTRPQSQGRMSGMLRLMTPRGGSKGSVQVTPIDE